MTKACVRTDICLILTPKTLVVFASVKVVCTSDNLGSSSGQTGNGSLVVVVLVMRSFRNRR
jgi:hypothetical protein